MTTKELLDWLDENGWEYECREEIIEITNWGYVYPKQDRIYFKSGSAFARKQIQLIKKMIEYMETPIADREEPKKFYIKPKGMNITKNYTLNYDVKREYWFINAHMRNNGYIQTQFTLKELEELGIDVNHYYLEEVEQE